MYDNRSIGIFDSGFGGLSVVKSCIGKMPCESIVYFGDTAHAPYGDRPKKEIIDLALAAADFFVKKNVKALVIACNTVSACACKQLKKRLEELGIVVIEIISLSVKKILYLPRGYKVGIAATKATVRSHVYRNWFLKHFPKINVYSHSCPLLVSLIEKEDIFQPEASDRVQKALAFFKKKNVDALFLGCTHYPLIKNLIADDLGKDVKIMDPSNDIAEGIDGILKKRGRKAAPQNIPSHGFYTSGNLEYFAKKASQFLKMDISAKKR